MMDFEYFIKSLEISLKDLPGVKAQLRMVPITRHKEFSNFSYSKPPRKSAILILFYPEKGKIKTVLMERASDNTIHSGQISFPGGKFEKSDKSLVQTALREAYEEIGIDTKTVKIIGSLTKLYIPPSNFDVYPFVGYCMEKPSFIANNEVSSILEVELSTLIDPATFTEKTIEYRTGKIVDVPCFFVNGHIIWGATSMIISELLEVVRGL